MGSSVTKLVPSAPRPRPPPLTEEEKKKQDIGRKAWRREMIKKQTAQRKKWYANDPDYRAKARGNSIRNLEKVERRIFEAGVGTRKDWKLMSLLDHLRREEVEYQNDLD